MKGRRTIGWSLAALALAACQPPPTTRQPEPKPETAPAEVRYPPGGAPKGTTPKQSADLQVV